ncbi:DNA-3-methyladenine glycosylase 2 family protein [Caldimonas sp.]|uniref:DNA-3-methyladenine glycosylase 2 family protein n=1 Tax=Caldimonas sp. TaxID=2838790 RepID=UPI0039195531
MLDHDAAYAALQSRDARFDGCLFVGVTSTGIYCRPVCRVRTPLQRNCRFFESAAQAEAARFRPCLKCRPEVAPGQRLAWTVMDASRTLARQAAAWLDAQAGLPDGPPVSRLAQSLGISDRHLRRIFQAEHGVTPLQYLQTRRLLLAKQLLTDTDLPVTDVALASGFGSLRRFHATFADHYRLQPTELRRQRLAAPEPQGPVLRLAYRPPHDLAALWAFLAQRALPGVEAPAPGGWRRSLQWPHPTQDGRWLSGWLAVRFNVPRARVELQLSPALVAASSTLLPAVRRWLDLDALPEQVDARLKDLPHPGMRLPGALDPFELAVRAVLGQQVTVAAARTLATRLVDAYGETLESPWPEVRRCFPRPERLAEAAPEALGRLGLVRQRAVAIGALARAWPTLSPLLRAPTLGGAPHPVPAAVQALQALPGVGPWTAHYIAMRALGWPDAFPPGDVAVLKALSQRLGRPCSVREAEQLAEAWRPWRAYAVIRLWAWLDPAQAPSPPLSSARTDRRIHPIAQPSP